ncbi:hypothetical protein Q5752_000489 [Cryptotrichosporon argae]
MFTPLQTLFGGLLLHISSSSLLHATGRVLGISGVLDGALFGDRAGWRWALLAGLAAAPALVHALRVPGLPDAGVDSWAALGPARLALAGFLVGLGAKVGSGCTSGHFLCGVSRLSKRSIVATATFFMTAVTTAHVFPVPLAEARPAYTLAPVSKHESRYLLPLLVGFMAAHVALGALLRAYPVRALAPLPYLLAGTTFGAGLVVSGMVAPLKVLGFLRLLPPWHSFDPSLALVVVGGVLPNALDYARAARRASLPWETWRVPSRTDVDARLVAGAAVFGVGWGLCGVCPGPAVVTVGQMVVQHADAAAFMAWAAFMGNMLLGLGAGHFV